jgi:hypothetical protein
MGEGKSKRSRVAADTPVEEIGFDVAPPSAEAEPTKKIKKSKRSSEAAITPAEVVPESTESKMEVIATNDEPDEPDVPAMSHREARLAKRRKLSGIIDPPATTSLQSSSMHPSRVISLAGNTIQGAPGVTVGNTPGKLISQN